MKNAKTLILLSVVFVLLIAGAYVLYDRLGQEFSAEQMIMQTQQPTPSPQEQESGENEVEAQPQENLDEPQTIPAPDFTVYDRNKNPVNLSDFFGKPIVLNFWASWCGPCQSEMPAFEKKYTEVGEEVHFLMINMTDGGRETMEKAAAFIEKNGYHFPVFFDTTSQAAMTYAAYSLPTTYFINAQGHVIGRIVGAIDEATLERGISLIRGEAQ